MAKHIKIQDDRFLNNLGRCWLNLKQAGRKMLGLINLDLTIEQVMALKILETEEGLSLSEIAERADRERTTMTRMIDGLERRDLVVRIPDKSDNRRKLLYLTRRGQKQLLDLAGVVDDFAKIAYAGIAQEDMERTSRILEQIAENLEKM